MKKILLILFAIFLFLQFFQIEKTNPTVNKGMDFTAIKKTPEPIAKIIRNSCYDCHSNETKYPWYSYVQPFGWILKNHINEGRSELNFSTFSIYEAKKQAHKLKECIEQTEQNKMPLESYLIAHPDSKLSNEQRKELVDYFKKIQKDIQISNAL